MSSSLEMSVLRMAAQSMNITNKYYESYYVYRGSQCTRLLRVSYPGLFLPRNCHNLSRISTRVAAQSTSSSEGAIRVKV